MAAPSKTWPQVPQQYKDLPRNTPYLLGICACWGEGEALWQDWGDPVPLKNSKPLETAGAQRVTGTQGMGLRGLGRNEGWQCRALGPHGPRTSNK